LKISPFRLTIDAVAPEKKSVTAYAVWPTAWGPMGAARSAAGVCRVILPHYQGDQLRDLLTWEYHQATNDESPFAELIAMSRDYFNGKVVDFASIVCDLPAEDSFSGKVLRACRSIPYGQTRSYHILAEMIGSGDAARAAAGILSKNAVPLVVPCHRVIYADGQSGGFSAPGGEAVKKRLLELERTVAGPRER
jgi:methylated-DNA-[protein]-cysteine S-methyltransferase